MRVEDCLKALRRSEFTSKFRLNRNDGLYVQEKGLDLIRGHALRFLIARIATARPKNDGRQTPMRGHPVFVSQHATATCCRNCIKKWFGIGKGRALAASEIDFFVDMIMAWIKDQIQAHTGLDGERTVTQMSLF